LSIQLPLYVLFQVSLDIPWSLVRYYRGFQALKSASQVFPKKDAGGSEQVSAVN
jgi:hypothetical protein